MITLFDYKTPKTLEEACRLLSGEGGRTKVIAGGTDLVIRLRSGEEKPDRLVDVTFLEDLKGIRETDDAITIGATVSHSEIASSPLIRRYGEVLSEAASQIGSPQIRNLGTIGGNIINASPAADTLPALMVLEAVGEVVSSEGIREVPVRQLIKGPYESALTSNELLVRIVFKKLPQDVKGSYIRLARREAMAIARMSVALLVQIVDGKIRDFRFAPGAVLPVPDRLEEVETFLKGRSPEEETLKSASKKATEAMIKRSGVRPSTSYKAPVMEALFCRAMRKGLERWQ